VKGYCSEKTAELLPVALQIFGGAGYVQDHPIEQYIRDQKIDTLYEGTTHIQALDLLFRKLVRDRGATLRALAEEIQSAATAGSGLAFEREALGRALGDVQALLGALVEKTQGSVYHAGFQGNRLLFALAELVIGWLLVQQAEVAEAALPAAKGDDRDFYLGKLAVSRYWSREVLPKAKLARKLVESSSLDLMELPETAY
jgi:hypothetical protein